MAINTYATLLTAAANWIKRSDLTDRIPEFIALTEAKANRELDCRQMYTRNAAFSITGASVALPTGFAGVRGFHLNTSPISELEFVKADDFDTLLEAARDGVGRPRYYTIVGDNFLFSPTPDDTYTATLVYRQTLTALSVSNATNWLLTAHPDVYLNGVLAHANQYVEDDNMEAKYFGLFVDGVNAINRQDSRHAYGSAPARRVRGFV